MTSPRRRRKPDPQVVAIVAFDGMQPFHLAVPCAVFGADDDGASRPRFELRVCGLTPGPLRTSAGFTIQPAHGLDALAGAGLVIVPSWHGDDTPVPEALIAALRDAAARGARIVGLCLGALVLARAGLLDGRRATTHWLATEQLAREHPTVEVHGEVLYVDDGDIVTSAGTAAAIDCCLHLLREQCGAEVASQVARHMVVAPHRAGGQAQFIDAPLPRRPADTRLAEALDWVAARLDQPHALDDVAARARMSRRSFTRHMLAGTGTSFGDWLLGQRLLRARRLLEAGDGLSVERVAQAAGFGSAAALRQQFARVLGTTPTRYRGEFGA
ncbi:GlxA family transcriptional regulator [Derxia gummosa]|uniref:GlxA family transcriptional regulator n=1 Tax=Derxia gummosa DSM 723 TaxID=1121388 RepID=A0A8B6X8L3_9BURK|nr:helix-turn-helix domain-containing protein [Derxia gummosa]